MYGTPHHAEWARRHRVAAKRAKLRFWAHSVALLACLLLVGLS